MKVTLRTLQRLVDLRYAASTDEERPVMCGVQVEFSPGGVRACATNSYIAARVDVDPHGDPAEQLTWSGLLVTQDLRAGADAFASRTDETSGVATVTVEPADDGLHLQLDPNHEQVLFPDALPPDELASYTVRLIDAGVELPKVHTLFADTAKLRIEEPHDQVVFGLNAEYLAEAWKTSGAMRSKPGDRLHIVVTLRGVQRPIHMTSAPVVSEPGAEWEALVMPVRLVDDEGPF